MVSNAVTAAQGACASLLSVGIGTPLRAILESVSAMGLWFQYQLLLVNAKIYLSTSSGTDIDTWVGQFGMTRMGGTAATGSETFISFTPDQQSATIAVGATVKTPSGIIYAVVEDSSNPWWSAASGAYIRPIGTASITVPVQCQTAGTAGNVDAGTICLLGTSISGIDTCTNGA
ncbi:baseplate J/gp47 family protein, partial [Acetobacter sicerae]|uniref:baseplate J/gp47 family protein n=1 Tax=Acetobacter sicerae TaxID=85325 RepID=UPI00156BD03D